jgi:hypothetical protein
MQIEKARELQGASADVFLPQAPTVHQDSMYYLKVVYLHQLLDSNNSVY